MPAITVEDEDTGPASHLPTQVVIEHSWARAMQRRRSLGDVLWEPCARPGDRVVAYMPNIREAVAACCAFANLGAIWASAAPEFGGMRGARYGCAGVDKRWLA